MTFKNKVAVVTGGGDGIGQATCALLAEKGAVVYVQDINEANARRVADHLNAQGMQAYALVGDVSDEEQVLANVKEVIEKEGQIDVLVNNAGIGTVAPAVDYIDWRRVISVNLDGPFYWSRIVAANSMIPSGGGAIVNVSSMAGLAGIPEDVGYVSSKHAIVGLTKALAVEWAKHSIRVNCVCPGSTDTMLFRSLTEKAPERFARRVERIPAGRVSQPIEQARLIAFLASSDASYVSGAIIANDGGQMALFSGMTAD